MRHPTEGVLRRLVDEPAGVTEADRSHVAGCARCDASVAEMRRDAKLLGAALATDTTVDTDAAWRRLSTTTPQAYQRPRTNRFRALVRRPAFGFLAVAVVLTGAGTAAANDWLQIFGAEKVAAFSIKADDLVALPDLRAYGTVELSGRGDVHEVADAATAATESGLDLPAVGSLPKGVTGTPEYQVAREVTATFTFSAERAAAAAAKAGKPLPTPPPGLDGHSVRLVAGPGVAQVWGSSSGVPALVVGRAVAPKAFSSGVPFETVRDYVLSLPGLPPKVASQLRTFAADGSTLPIPVPEDRVTSSTAEVDGASATVLAARDRTMAAVVWVKDGLVTVVAGSLDTDEVLSVARGLR
ncbi:MAG: hypothetical protein QOE05_3094 [Actinomycetota bacterium]|jgi:hypothetical protein|nr:hypothetical protein [Actinomycetota bacterium]